MSVLRRNRSLTTVRYERQCVPEEEDYLPPEPPEIIDPPPSPTLPPPSLSSFGGGGEEVCNTIIIVPLGTGVGLPCNCYITLVDTSGNVLRQFYNRCG